MSNKKKNNNNAILFLCLIGVVIVCIVAITVIRKIPSDRKEHMTSGQTGNTSGNLNNKGLFVQDGNTIYFINSLDNDYIYSMNTDTSNQKCHVRVAAQYLNSYGDYLYYSELNTTSDGFLGFLGNMNGIYAYKKGSKNNTKGFKRTKAGIVNVFDNTIYFQNYDDVKGMTFYKVSVNGGKPEEISEEIINPSCVINNEIYYPDQENWFYVNKFTPQTNAANLFIKERMYSMEYDSGYIYYINVEKNYSLYRYNVSNHTTEQLTADRVDCFNVLNGTIFYQKNSVDSPELIRMNNDGSNKEVIAHGNYTNINMTDFLTFFYDFEDKTKIYMVNNSGSTNVVPFVPTIESK